MACLLLALAFAAQLPGAAGGPAGGVHYTLAVDSIGATSARVEIEVPDAPDTLRLALPVHPEYDDRFWRYVRDLHVERGGREVPIVREDSNVWRAAGHGNAIVRYVVEPPFPEAGRGSWTAFLSTGGGLLGGPHTFMYMLGHERAAARATVLLPNGWTVATGLSPRGGGEYAARDARDLIDSPIMVGPIRRWTFAVDGVPHEVAYLPAVGGVQFDTAAMVAGLARFATEAHRVFGVFPYRRFVFLVQEGAGGGLEHGTSVSLGLSATDMASGGSDFYSDAAHEYFHAWNAVALRPRGWGGLSARAPGGTHELWWMEGVTMYYASTLSRRAMLPVEWPTRREELAHDIGQYLDNPSNALVSPEDASWWSGTPSARRGDFTPDYYLQGKLLGTVLDLQIRAATRGRRSLDDAMRRLFTANREPRGYSAADIERAVAAACQCPMRQFFADNVRHASTIDFDAALRGAGLRAEVAVVPAVDSAGRPLPDIRVWASMPRGVRGPRLFVTQPDGAWARAGLHTRDVIVSWNGAPLAGFDDFRTKLRRLAAGDSVAIDYLRDDVPGTATVRIDGYDVHRVRLVMLPGAGLGAAAIRRAALLEAPPIER